MTWAKAKEFCETYGMHLASPKTIEEIKGVRSLALRMGTKYYYWWVSPSNVGQSSPGDFRWHDMTKLPIDSPLWSNSQPNDYFGTAESTCGYFHSDADLQPFLERLLDGPCTKSNNFVCEVPAKCLYLNI
ncbi:lectin-like [Cloeon dipterum]|uniref:lectin-like n=1 Tax=Cloeon dipterum TaxID=197152 RepID=UPI003220155D